MDKFAFGLLCFSLVVTAYAKDGELLSEQTAKLFGSQPDVRDVHLSPDGSKLSMLKAHPDGYTIAMVVDLVNPKSTVIMSSRKDVDELGWCHWANTKRLLCAYALPMKRDGRSFTVSRMMGVNADGTEAKLLLEDQLGDKSEDQFSQIQTNVIDWLPEDPDHVLIQTVKPNGTGVGILDVNTGRFTAKEKIRDGVYGWITDGHGNPRLYVRIQGERSTWFLLKPGELTNEEIRSGKIMDMADEFNPEGFGEDPDELLYFGKHEGRTALFAMKLSGDRRSRLVYFHPQVDVGSLQRMGKHDRVVGAIFAEDTVRYHHFDEDVRRIYDAIKKSFPDDTVTILDEDWNRRYYLVVISRDTNPGTYYRYDRQVNKLAKIGPVYSSLKDQSLSKMETVSYPARDGKAIPAYLSLPSSGKQSGLPAVILPHGGPSSRDVWGFDFLVQYLTAKGYAVLQSNYRGSAGYGKDWEGDGAFRNWRTAIDDIADGAKYLVDKGIADASRICVAGWSYGGYAALMSGIEEPNLYRCVVSVAGVTDPQKLGWSRLRFVGGTSAKSFIGTEDEVVIEGAPVKRAAEFQMPVLLVHAEQDVNVPFKQSEAMYDALIKNGKSAEFITYEYAEHSITPERYRIDLLTRMGGFLDRHTNNNAR